MSSAWKRLTTAPEALTIEDQIVQQLRKAAEACRNNAEHLTNLARGVATLPIQPATKQKIVLKLTGAQLDLDLTAILLDTEADLQSQVQ